MAEGNKSSDMHSAKDLRHFLDQEITLTTKGADLRIRELTQLVTAYAAGEITPEEANKQFDRYYDKWGDALPGGVMIAQGESDEAILAAIEGTAGAFPFTRRLERQSRGDKLPGNNKDREP